MSAVVLSAAVSNKSIAGGNRTASILAVKQQFSELFSCGYLISIRLRMPVFCYSGCIFCSTSSK